MKRVFLGAVSLFMFTASVLTIPFVDGHPVLGIFVVLGLAGGGMYHNLYKAACERHRRQREEFFIGLSDNAYDNMYDGNMGAEHSVFVSNNLKTK